MALTQARFNELVDEHGPAMYRIAFRMVGDAHEAEDVVQDTFRSAWKSRQRFEENRGDRAWLVAILRRRVVDRWRKTAPPKTVGDDLHLFEPGVEGDDPFRDGFSDEIQSALDQLPSQLKETLLLVVVGEMTHQEVSDQLEVPLGTVLSRVSRARKRLREVLVAATKM